MTVASQNQCPVCGSEEFKIDVTSLSDTVICDGCGQEYVQEPQDQWDEDN